jgi:hypothetical protein
MISIALPLVPSFEFLVVQKSKTKVARGHRTNRHVGAKTPDSQVVENNFELLFGRPVDDYILPGNDD